MWIRRLQKGVLGNLGSHSWLNFTGLSSKTSWGGGGSGVKEKGGGWGGGGGGGGGGTKACQNGAFRFKGGQRTFKVQKSRRLPRKLDEM